MRTFVIARLTFFEASRRKILLAALLAGLVFLVVFGFGFKFIIDDLEQTTRGPDLLFNEINNFLLMAGFYVVNFLTIMMMVLTSVDTLSGEITTGTIQTLITKPLNRWEIIAGKWLGFSILLVLYVLLMAGGITAIVFLISGYTAPQYWKGLALIWLNGELMLCVSLFGGAFLSTLANGVLVFGLFGISFVGGWIEQIGSFIENQAAINIGIISSLLMPSEAIWKRAAFEMRSPLVSAVGFSPFSSSSSIPSPLMVYYAFGYGLAALLIGVWIFRNRDI